MKLFLCVFRQLTHVDHVCLYHAYQLEHEIPRDVHGVH